jgi:hypothetical protein
VNSPELPFDSPLTSIASVPSPNSAPLEWYDLLAEDAINNIDKYNLNLDIGRAHLSRRESIKPDEDRLDPQLQCPDSEAGIASPHAHYQDTHRMSDIRVNEQWNTPENLPLNDDEIVLLQHYVSIVAPILDILDPTRQFSTTVPRLAVRNLGVLKSLLAVAARHLAILNDPQQNTSPNGTDTSSRTSPLLQMATQYYYETLHYLSQNLLYPLYSKSREIIATALLISTYEMFDADGAYSNGAWERHLRGIFWIQRAQNNNGESRDPLRRAAWWCWIRQDSWVAFREGRRVLTIWRPTRRLDDLTPDELCLRIVYICGRCIDFAANEKKYDVNTRIEQGQKLTQALDDWQDILPASFQPIYKLPRQVPSGIFAPIWINPPSYAAAIQTFHSARIIVLINQPSVGGMEEFQGRQRRMDESVENICGIAMMHQGKDISSAMVNVQALFTGEFIRNMQNSRLIYRSSWPLRTRPGQADSHLAALGKDSRHHKVSTQDAPWRSHKPLARGVLSVRYHDLQRESTACPMHAL